MRRLAEEGWRFASHRGRVEVGSIARAVARALRGGPGARGQQLAERLRQRDCDDLERLELITTALALEPLLLVLDDFEQNLELGGTAFLDPDTAELLSHLSRSASRGRLLLTCRHPLPAAAAWLQAVPVGPLSAAETRKLVQRLPGMRQLEPAALAGVLRRIGGHPRILEFLDGLLRQGEGRLPAVTERLEKALAAAGLGQGAAVADLEEGVRQAVALGMRDVLLKELVALARGWGLEELLFQAAVSGLETPVAGLVRMLEQGGDPAADAVVVEAGLERLAALSLLVRTPAGGAWVHRWTAEGLARLAGAAAWASRCRRAGDYRLWRMQHESGEMGAGSDAIEALRNFLQAEHWDGAAGVWSWLVERLQSASQTLTVAALAAEVLERLPEKHGSFSFIADAEASAHLALGETDRALVRYQQILAHFERLAKSEPERADYQRDLSVSYNKMGDLYVSLGQVEAARQAFASSLSIAERLAKSEPERADNQLDLVVSWVKVATAEGSPNRPLLERALALLQELQRQGRLAPADQAKIAALQEMLAELDQPS